jgi:hypothetical protein
VAKRLIAAGEGGSIVATASLAGVIGNAAVDTARPRLPSSI